MGERPIGRSPFHREWRRQRAYDVLPVFPPVVRGIMRSIWATLRVSASGEEHLASLAKAGRPFVLSFFHGRQFLLVRQFRGLPLVIMTGVNYLGEIQTRVLRGFGYRTVRGSTSHHAARVLAQLVREVRGGASATFAVDGPRGPHRVVKPGAVFIAKKVGVPVMPVSSSARPAFVLHSGWDKYILPMPFARGHVVCGKPLVFDGDLSDGAVQRDSEALGRELLALDREADAAVGREPL